MDDAETVAPPAVGRSCHRTLHGAVPFVVAALLGVACSGGSGSVRFEQPPDGAFVSGPVAVEMVADGFTVEPVAFGVGAGRGHFHIIVDAPCAQPGVTVGTDPHHLHFGDGRSTAVLELEPGVHDLCLQAADGNHTALDLTHQITITVEP